MNIKDSVKEYIINTILENEVKKVMYEDDLVEKVGITSLQMVEIIVFCEEKFNCEFEFDELDLNNFRTLTLIEKTILENLDGRK